jgi:DAACS family dicarboxylate/amino acid:cation (Na+ or H+) symporter
MSEADEAPGAGGKRRMPLYARILLAVLCGSLFGLLLPRWAGRLGEAGMLVIRLLKALATPLILFAILDSLLRTAIPARRGVHLVLLSALNAIVATALGLLVANGLRAGESWRDQVRSLAAAQPAAAAHGASAAVVERASLDPLRNLAGYIPESLVEPFMKNNIIPVVLLALLTGAALRRVRDREARARARGAPAPPGGGVATVEALVHTGLQLFGQMLEWLIWLIPFAVFGVLASVVSKSGLGIFRSLGVFLGVILLGLALHVFVYYSVLLVVLGRSSPWRFFAGALDALLTALSCGSSLATLPVTLRCLTGRLGVSQESARLAACVGTNLNHDGIILYEAGAAVFLAQAFGYPLGLEQQVAIALSAVMAGIGIAGVPEAGLITLPLVLAAAGLPEQVAAIAIPLILPVDWIIGRCRAATNVTSDMIVATILDRFASPPAPATDARTRR